MKTLSPFRICHLLMALIFFAATVTKAEPDPVKISITTNAAQVGIGEEITLTVTASFVNFPPNTVFLFKESNAYRIKVIMPDGFKQTGGDYVDYIDGKLSQKSPSATYTIKGKFETTSSSNKFVVLRGGPNAHENGDFKIGGVLNFEKLDPIQANTKTEDARLAAVPDDGLVPFVLVGGLQGGLANEARVVEVVNNFRVWTYWADKVDASSVDDGTLVIVDTQHYTSQGGLRYKIMTPVTPELFGARADNVADDADAMELSLQKTGRIDLLPNKRYRVITPIKVTGASAKRIIINGNGSRIWVPEFTGQAQTGNTVNDGIFKFSSYGSVQINDLQIETKNYLDSESFQGFEFPSLFLNNCDTVSITNCKITTSPFYPILVNGGRDIKIHKNIIDRYWRVGIEVRGATTSPEGTNVIISDNSIFGTGDVGKNNTTVLDGPGLFAAGSGIGIQVLMSNKVIVKNNLLDQTLDTGIKVETSLATLIDGNSVSRFGKDGIKVHGRGDRPQIYNATITNNHVYDKFWRRPDGKGLIVVHDADGFNISNNSLSDTTFKAQADIDSITYGILVSNLNSIYRNGIISNNIIKKLVSGHEGILISADTTKNNGNLYINNNVVNSWVRFDQVKGKIFFESNIINYSGPKSALTIEECYNTSVVGNTITTNSQGVESYFPTHAAFKLTLERNKIQSVGDAVTFNTSRQNDDERYVRLFEAFNNEISTSGSGTKGIYARSLTELKIKDNQIEGSPFGIHVHLFSPGGNINPKVEVDNNVIKNSISNPIYIQGGGTYTIDYANITRNKIRGLTGSNAAITVRHGNATTFKSVRVLENDIVFKTGMSTPSNYGFKVEHGVAGNGAKYVDLLTMRDNYVDNSQLVDVLSLPTHVKSFAGTPLTYSNLSLSIPANGQQTRTISIPVLSSTTNNVLTYKLNVDINSNIITTAKVTGNDAVTVTYRNLSGSAVNYAAGTHSLLIEQ